MDASEPKRKKMKLLSFLGKNTSFKPQNSRAMDGDVDGKMIFSEGREVEVTSDEEGYKGAWFTATIVKPPKSNSKGKALVRYKNLLEGDNETPLTENITLSFIRPLPPQPQIPGDQCFEVKDVVDAFYLDGWWAGSVSEVFDNPKRYIVSFTNPPEEIEFSPSDLRPHWEWVDGKWVKSSKFQEILVSSDCQGPFVLSCNSTKDAGTAIQLESFIAVKCSRKKQKLRCVGSRKNKMGLSTASKEPAKSKHVKRATHEGDATPLHPSKKSKDGSLANSFVPESHMKEVLVSSVCQELVERSCNTSKDAGTTIQLESSDTVKYSRKKLELCSVFSRKNEIDLLTSSKKPAKRKHVKQATPEANAMPLHPSKKSKDGSLEKSLVPESHMKEVLVSSDCKEPVELSCNTTKDAGTTIHLSSDTIKCSRKKLAVCCTSSTKNEIGLSNASKEPKKSKHVKQAPEGDITVTERMKLDTNQPKAEGVREENVDFLKKGARLLSFHVEAPQHPAADKMDDLKVVAAIEVSEEQQMTKELEYSATTGFQIECLSSSVTEESCHVTKEEINLQKKHGMSIYQNEDGANNGINRIALLDFESEISQSISVPVLLFSQSPSIGKGDAAGVLEEIVSEEHTARAVFPFVMSGLEQAGPQTMSTERFAVVSATDCLGERIEVAEESGRILHENEEQSPLICCNEQQPGFGKIHSLEENNTGKKSLEIVVQSDDDPQDGQDLPFVKSLPMWKEVESMEIFQAMPQNPHFYPLVKSNEILREGLAVGHMLSFASLVQRTSKLTVADPRNLFISILDALPDFEIFGFDVKAVRNRTNDLLLMKDRREHLQGHSKEVKLQVKQCYDDLTKINEEIDANYKMVRELEEKQALLLSMKESKTSQINSLQVRADVTTQDIQSVEHDFEFLAGSSW